MTPSFMMHLGTWIMFLQKKFQEVDIGYGTPKPRTKKIPSQNQGWIPWILSKCGVNFTMTTYTTSGGDNFSAETYSSIAGTSATYTNKQTRSYMDENGRRVTIKFIERDGNRIEDKYMDRKLVERQVNGIVEPLVEAGYIQS
mmetsp:Transcript_26662/g.61329  ORF Transcript_26662/g.61329 Transcript_26662/m.61329 type:complete len:142 (-) Transcript_26662:238-663(-)